MTPTRAIGFHSLVKLVGTAKHSSMPMNQVFTGMPSRVLLQMTSENQYIPLLHASVLLHTWRDQTVSALLLVISAEHATLCQP